MQVLLGGTFSILHKAHKEMIGRGLKIGDLIIGLTSDRFNFNKRYEVPPYETRKKNLENYLKSIGASAVIRELMEPYGSTLSPEFGTIVSSNETFDFISNVNFMRRSKGIQPLRVENVGEILADDLMPIKSERIIKGRIDENGRRKSSIEIVLATKNPEKIKGARSFFDRTFKMYAIETLEPKIRAHPQPVNNEIFEGAKGRVEGIDEGYDYAIGIEAGIISFHGINYDTHVAAVKDSLGSVSYGISSGLPINNSIMESVKHGFDLEEITNKLIGVDNSGDFRGASYYFSRGLKERNKLVEEALESAFIQRTEEAVPRKVI